MLALVLLLLGVFAIAAFFVYSLMAFMLVAASAVLMVIVVISVMVGNAGGPFAGLLSFAMLITGACVILNEYFEEPERSRKHD